MSTSTFHKTGLFAAAAAASALVAIGVPLAIAAPPIATPQSDVQGYLDSTARCTAPDTAVIFGTTDSSRVAICKTANGSYEYRGVRVRDGAKLIVPATQTSTDSYMAEGDGATYTITTTALSVTSGGSTVRTEAWTDFHNPQSPAGSGTAASGTATSGTSKPATSGAATSSAKPSTSSAATSGAATSGASTSAAPQATKTTAAPVTSAPPLPPPLPAEVGGGSSSSR